MKTTIRHNTNLSRRKFIISTAAASGGLAIGMNLPFMSSAQAQTAAGAGTEVNAWVVIKPDDTCVIRIARAEMGQGTHDRVSPSSSRKSSSATGRKSPSNPSRRDRISPASACGATCPPAAAAAYAPRRTMCARAAPLRA